MNRPRLMKLDRPSDFVDVFIRASFSVSHGWTEFTSETPEHNLFEYRYRSFEGDEVLILRIEEPLVSASIIKSLSNCAKTIEQQKVHGRVNVLIFCGQLLMQPNVNCKNVRVVSLVEEQENPFSDQAAFVSSN